MQEKVTISKLLASVPGLKHGFLTDHSPGGRDALDKLAPGIATVKQVHGAKLLWAERPEKRERDADGLATFVAGLPVGVYSADCAPLLVAALGAKGPIGVMAVHGGWRGTALQIARSSFAEFASSAKARGAGEFVAAIGPCISFSSFEVGPEVVEAFPGAEERGLARFLRLEGEKKKYLFDLPGENARQLREAAAQSGVALKIDELEECTLLNRDRFPSYRRDREKAGRILSYLSFGS